VGADGKSGMCSAVEFLQQLSNPGGQIELDELILCCGSLSQNTASNQNTPEYSFLQQKYAPYKYDLIQQEYASFERVFFCKFN
jgi:hypothetical protein